MVSCDLDSHCVLIFTLSHFTNPPRDRLYPQFVSQTSTYWHVIKKHLIIMIIVLVTGHWKFLQVLESPVKETRFLKVYTLVCESP